MKEIDNILILSVDEYNRMFGKELYVFYTREHRGILEDSLKTRKQIDVKHFNNLLKFYSFYCFDERINSFVFILNDMEHNLKYPTWLEIHIRGKKDE